MMFMDDGSVDSIVTDPPYGLRFMGKAWDYDVPDVAIWRECLRVLKPGGYLLSFAGARTQHRMCCNIEDAGFEIRDMIAWVYGSGFPKSMDVSKAIDKAAGAAREIIGISSTTGARNSRTFDDGKARQAGSFQNTEATVNYKTTPATEAAHQWAGWGTALKPAIEPITVARKPLIGTVAENVLAHGTGAINIDACRVPPDSEADDAGYRGKCKSVVGLDSNRTGAAYGSWPGERTDSYSPEGRYPANLIHDGSPKVVALFPESAGSGGSVPNVKITGYGDGAVGTGSAEYLGGERTKVDCGSGSAARFFARAPFAPGELDAAVLTYCKKANKRDRGDGNTHPTVKPTELMRYLCRLVTPPGGTVLDPFMGSGTTGRAAMLEGFRFIGMDREAEFVEIAQRRIVEAWERDHV